jgi:hypothetical protein
MMTEIPLDALDLFRRRADLSHGELWLRYFALGGMSTGLQLEAYLYGALRPSRQDHDIIAHALNERFVEMGGNHPVPYADDNSGDHTDDFDGNDADVGGNDRKVDGNDDGADGIDGDDYDDVGGVSGAN